MIIRPNRSHPSDCGPRAASDRRMGSLRLSGCCLVWVWLLAAQYATGDDDPKQATAHEPTLDQRTLWNDYYEHVAKSFVVKQPTLGGKPLQLVPQPVLNYENPVRIYDQHGSLFVWTRDGRVQFAGAVWSGRDTRLSEPGRALSHEGHTLSPAEVIVSQDGQTLWRSEPDGAVRHKIEEPPARQRFARLTQMRRLVTGLDIKIHTDTGDLRLMTQPIYRYEEPQPPVADGALFTWVMGTDPEVFALVEAVDDHWLLTIARFTNEPLTVRRDGELLYECEQSDIHITRGPYWLNVDVAQLPNLPPTTSDGDRRAN